MENINSILIYLFGTPPQEFEYQVIVQSIAIVLLVASIGGYFAIKSLKHAPIKRIIKGYPMKLGITALAILCALFFRNNSAPILSSRILLGALIALGLYYLAKPFSIYRQEVPMLVKRNQAKAEAYKYLPRKKKKKKKKR